MGPYPVNSRCEAAPVEATEELACADVGEREAALFLSSSEGVRVE